MRPLRTNKAQEVDADLDGYIALIAAMVRRAEIDMTLPVDARLHDSTKFVTVEERQSAQSFLADLRAQRAPGGQHSASLR